MENIKKFIELVSNEQFAQAHEVLEDDWKEFKKQGQKEKARFYKGIINGATAIELIKRERSLRARTITWDTYQKYKIYINTLDIQKQTEFNKAIQIIESKYKKFS